MFSNINGRNIGPGYPAYIVAEISANHNQDYNQAADLIKRAKEAGADAVKLQTYTPDTITMDSDSALFRRSKSAPYMPGSTLHEIYSIAYTPWEWQPKLKELADSLGITLFSTPFDKTAVDFLEGMSVPAYKVASFEIIDTPLIEYIAGKGKPMIISTGMATLGEIDEAVRAARKGGNTQVALLKCTTAYPAPPGEMNLRTIPHMSQAFGVPVGLSDHTLGIAVPVAAVALGACIVEKHFTLSRSIPGPDTAFSLEPQELKVMVEVIRTAEQSLGRIQYEVSEKEANSRTFRRSLFVVKDIRAGEPFTDENVRSIRPGHGLHPRYLNEVIGKHARQDISRGTPLTLEMISWL